MVNYEELFFKLLEKYLMLAKYIEDETDMIFEGLYEEMRKQGATPAEIIRYAKCEKRIRNVLK